MTNVVLNEDGAPSWSIEISAETLTKVRFKASEKDAIRQVRILTAAVITVVETAAPGAVPTVAEFITAQLAAMDKAVAILNAV